MFLYDTRNKNINLPLNGWFFPCIFCFTITSYTVDILTTTLICKCECRTVVIPVCKKCIHKKLPRLKENRIIYVQ